MSSVQRQLRDFSPKSMVTLLLLCMSLGNLPAQSTPIIRTYNTEDGLSSHNIIGVHQGEMGYLWIATDDGLNRFDGQKFTVYRNEPGDTTTLSDTRITVLHHARYHSDQILWVGTRNGLNRLDLKSGLSRMFLNDPENENSLSNPTITAIASDSDGYLWVGTEDGLNVLTPGGQSIGYFRRIRFDEAHEEREGTNFIRSIEIGPGYGSGKTIWVGTRNGLKHIQYQTKDSYIVEDHHFGPSSTLPYKNEIRALRLQESKGEINLYIGTDAGEIYKKDLLSVDSQPQLISELGQFIRDIEIDPLGQIWIATYGSGLVRLREDARGGYSSDRYVGSPQLRNSLSNSHVVDLCQDRSGILWVGTDNGLNSVLQPLPGFKTHIHQNGNANSIIGNGIRSVFEDSQGGLWVGTVSMGLTYISPDRTEYEHFTHDPDDPNSLTSNSIASITEDRYGNMWFGIWDGGLLKMNGRRDGFKVFTHDPGDPNSPPHNIIQGILEDPKGYLWLNTSGGLSRFDPVVESFTNYIHSPEDSSSISGGDLQSKAIYLDREQRLWVGSYGGGLNCLDLKDPRSMDPKTAVFHHYLNIPGDENSLSNDMIISLQGTWDGQEETLWAGTFNSGLNRIPLSELTLNEYPLVTRYDETDGLCDNVVFGIEEDNRGQLWMSTGAGLAHFDPVKEQFESYFVEDGLPANSFFWGASHVSSSGEMFFGGTDGLVHFYPESVISIRRHAPKMSITQLNTLHGPLTRRPKDFQLSYHVFHYDDLPLSIEWALFDFIKPERNQYWYQIDELHENWIPAGNATSANFSHLPGGVYTFRVKGANNNGLTSSNDGIVRFRVRPPFYQTLLFKILMLVMLGLLIYLLIAFRMRVIASTNKQLLSVNEELSVIVREKEEAEERLRSSLKEKEALLREIYHRTKNNMSVIISILNIQSAKLGNPQITNIFEEVKGRIFAMSLVHEHLMKADDLSAINLNNYIQQLMDNLFRSAHFNSSKITRTNAIEPNEVSIDTAVPLGLVLNEIITNALRYAFPQGRQGEISIVSRMQDDQLYIQVKDDGIGFDQKKIEEEGSSLGLGIIKSIVEHQLGGSLTINSGEGTTYEIILDDIQIVRRV